MTRPIAAVAVFRVEDRFVLDGRLHRKFGGFVAAQDAVDVARRLPKHVEEVGSVGHETTGGDHVTERVAAGKRCRAASAMTRSRWTRVVMSGGGTRPPFGASAND